MPIHSKVGSDIGKITRIIGAQKAAYFVPLFSSNLKIVLYNPYWAHSDVLKKMYNYAGTGPGCPVDH